MHRAGLRGVSKSTITRVSLSDEIECPIAIAYKKNMNILSSTEIFNCIDLLVETEKVQRMEELSKGIHDLMEGKTVMDPKDSGTLDIIIKLHNMAHEYLLISSHVTDGYTEDMAYAKLVMNMTKRAMKRGL